MEVISYYGLGLKSSCGFATSCQRVNILNINLFTSEKLISTNKNKMPDFTYQIHIFKNCSWSGHWDTDPLMSYWWLLNNNSERLLEVTYQRPRKCTLCLIQQRY